MYNLLQDLLKLVSVRVSKYYTKKMDYKQVFDGFHAHNQIHAHWSVMKLILIYIYNYELPTYIKFYCFNFSS